MVYVFLSYKLLDTCEPLFQRKRAKQIKTLTVTVGKLGQIKIKIQEAVAKMSKILLLIDDFKPVLRNFEDLAYMF